MHSYCAKHSTRGSEGMPQENFEKLHLMRLNLGEFLVIYHATFDVPVDTGTQNFLKMYYQHAYPCWV